MFKKGFVGLMVFAMILTMVGAVTVPARAASDGDLIKMAGNSAVYYLNGGKRYVFPNQKTFNTWYADFSKVVTISESEMVGYPLGGNVTYRPGTRLVKITTVPTVYAVEPGGALRSIVSEANAKSLWGDNWNKMIDDVPDAFFVNYSVGAALTEGVYPTGTLVKASGSSTVYYIDGTTKRPVATGTAFEANGFSWANVLTASSLSGYTDGTSITGKETFSTVAGSGTTTGPAAGGTVTVALASSTAAAATIISDTAEGAQSMVPFVTVNFTAPADGAVTVNTLKYKRTGISADTDVTDLYLYDGMTRLAMGGSISSGVVTFNSASGLFTVPAGTTKAVTLKVDMTENTSAGKTMAFQLESVTTSNNATVVGSLPISGNTMTTASVTDLGYVTITNGDVPTSVATVNPGEKDFEVYKINLQASDQDLQLEYMKLTLLGSVNTSDLTNLKLTKSGVTLATGSINADRELVFDLTGSPYVIKKGENPTFSVRGDVVNGSTRTFRFSVEYSSDLVVKDNNYKVYVTPYTSTWSAKKSSSSSNVYTINSGSLAISLDTTSPTENVASGATNVKLATFKFEATGEDVKVNNLDIQAGTASGIEGGLDNGKIYLNGVQVGTTKDLTEATSVNFTFGSSFIVSGGTSALVDVYADIKTTTSTTISAGTVQISLVAGSGNAQGVSSLESISTTAQDGTALTVSAGSLTLIKYQAYGDQNIVKPATQAKVASFVVSAGAYEGVNVDTINISQATSGVMQNVKLMSGSTQIGSTKVTLTSTSATENVFSVSNLNLAANESKVIDVYADIKSSTGAPSIAIVVDLAGTTAITSTATTASDVTMQTMTISTGSITSADGGKPTSDLVIAGTTVTSNKVKFTATNEAFTVTKVRIWEQTSGNYDSIGKVILEYKDKSGNTVTKEGYLNASGIMDFTGLNMYVAKDSDAILTVKAEVPTVASGADSGDTIGLDFDKDNNFSALGEASNTTDTTPGADVDANNMIVRKTKPTLSSVAMSSSILQNGTSKTIGKFNVTADAAGALYVKEFNFSLATGSAVNVVDVKMYKEGVTEMNATAVDTVGGSVSIVLDTEEQIPAGSTVMFELKGTVSGAASGQSLAVSIKESALSSEDQYATATNYTDLALYETGGLLWSDGSVSPHVVTTSRSYSGCKYVKTLPLDLGTLSL
ncbi:hypothetical protein GYA54_01755 [Candidatus Kuenenbacteria bacterium]|nr:hypothetical protein [Candidatus Kuenenbacteria bacterium]